MALHIGQEIDIFSAGLRALLMVLQIAHQGLSLDLCQTVESYYMDDRVLGISSLTSASVFCRETSSVF